MADKVQKIKEWISKTQDGLMNAQGNFKYPEHEGAYNILCNLGAYIDSLQEEPVSSVWHDARKSVPENSISQIICIKEDGLAIATEGRIVSGTTKWAYLSDLLNLDNSCNFEKNLQEEPVSNVWHNMSEEAENGRNTIIIDPKGFYGAVLRKGGSQLRNHNKERYVKWAYIDDIINITNKEEPISEELEEASRNYADNEEYGDDVYFVIKAAFKAGAKWQEEQFEKNRLAHCDELTEEQAQIESDFVIEHLKENSRTPTFIDAIEYGMRLQKEQIKEALLSEVLPYFMHGGEADEVVAKLDEVLNQKK